MNKRFRKFIGIVLSVMMLCSVFTSLPSVSAKSCIYIDENGNRVRVRIAKTNQDLIFFENVNRVMESGLYTNVGDYTFNEQITVRGDVKILILSGSTYDFSEGIVIADNSSLTIYADEDGDTVLRSTGRYHYAGISCDMYSTKTVLNICGGTIEAQALSSSPVAAGIGSSAFLADSMDDFTLNIYGGDVTAKGGDKGPGVGINSFTQNHNKKMKINVFDGTLTAEGKGEYAGICVPNVSDEDSGLTVSGGTVNASGGTTLNNGGAGIGGNLNNLDGNMHCGKITITGGTVNANGGTNAAGIGGGSKGNGGTVTITGGTVNAEGGEYAPGIGGAVDGGKLIMSGGTLIAQGQIKAAGLGSPFTGDGLSTFSLEGGTITAVAVNIDNTGPAVNYKNAYGVTEFPMEDNFRLTYSDSNTGANPHIAGKHSQSDFKHKPWIKLEECPHTNRVCEPHPADADSGHVLECNDCYTFDFGQGDLIPHSYRVKNWIWANDYSSASAEIVCDDCGYQKEVTARVTADDPENACEAGTSVYTATIPYGDPNFSDTKSIYHPALGHNLQLVEAVTPTAEADGSIAYYQCQRCQKCFADENGDTEISIVDTVVPYIRYGTADDGTAKVTEYNGTDAEVVIPDRVPENYFDRNMRLMYVTEICADVFNSNSKITTLTAGDNLRVIGDSAFANCRKLTEITIGTGLEQIGANIVANSNKLETFWSETDSEDFVSDDSAFASASDNLVIYGLGNGPLRAVAEAANVYFMSINMYVAGHSVSLNGDIALNFYIYLPDGFEPRDFTARLTWDGRTITQKPVSTSENGANCLVSCEVAARYMTTDIQLELLYDGDVQITDIYSIKDYAKAAASNYASDAELKKLLCDMLDYGGAVQDYFDYDTDNKASSYISEIDPYWTRSDIGELPVDETNIQNLDSEIFGLRCVGVTMTATSKPSIRLFFDVTDETKFASSKVYIGGLRDSFRTTESGTKYIEIESIPTPEVFDSYSVSFTNGSDSSAHCYSGINYLRTIRSGSYSDNAKAAVNALYNFYLSAKAVI